jgi:Phage major capsid protein E
MRAMNTTQAGVVDVVLSNYARGYTNPEFIYYDQFPQANVPSRNMRMIKFGKESFRKLNTRRAPGAPLLTVQYGYAADPISLAQDALQGLVPTETAEEAARVPGINMGQTAVAMVMANLDLGTEIDAANLARNASLYAVGSKVALAGASRWDDAASDPAKDVADAKEVIRRMIGRYPNTLTIGAMVAKALRMHPKIKEQFKYTSADSITDAMLAAYFDVQKLLIGKAVFLPDGALETDAAQDVWGKDAILSYVSRTKNWMEPSFGYTYNLDGYPSVETPYYERGRRSWLYPMVVERRPFIVGADAGFLFQTCVS